MRCLPEDLVNSKSVLHQVRYWGTKPDSGVDLGVGCHMASLGHSTSGIHFLGAELMNTGVLLIALYFDKKNILVSHLVNPFLTKDWPLEMEHYDSLYVWYMNVTITIHMHSGSCPVSEPGTVHVRYPIHAIPWPPQSGPGATGPGAHVGATQCRHTAHHTSAKW